MELITNRTASDAERAKSLLDKGWFNMTDSDLFKSLACNKGK